ncbi:glucose-1-phosphate adenylyltransferase [Brucepastera parasyntrophica]|uniref:glucose-1-phosphate adenylyltransferase n=1 Tax=Brucepastera parasyntrophica TaxID=2880008 RepID=UPI00210B8348|nr:glucose-1-phosphate adenylyltransferase [Brucepastera parasyntrophica]ULQ59946.1 glucose-1-phosphate adenylyltransferase [Brucepastera parasyntrophica]
MSNILSIILGGGKGTRLYPLTKERSKPAVPFGGKHRIVDIPISNCINSGFNQIYVLTQFNSASLHLHIARAYNFDSFSRGFVEILAAEQTFDHSGWYEGTADAVRKNFMHFKTQKPTHYIILSGDQLYQMNLADFLNKHKESGAEITIACTSVTRQEASGLGILKSDKNENITEFLEKPGPEKNIDDWKIPPETRTTPAGDGKDYLASMGIYIFDAQVMEDSLNNTFTDFGKEVIPDAIKKYLVKTYVYNGYWEDIGTIRSFYEATLNLTELKPNFSFYDENNPIYTHNRNLPPSKINMATIDQANTSEGCIINNSTIKRSIVGIRSIIRQGVSLDGVICMGADWYETGAERKENLNKVIPDIGIGENTSIKNTIIDKNARIGKNVSIGMGTVPADGDYGFYHVVDGIYVITKNACVPDGTVI